MIKPFPSDRVGRERMKNEKKFVKNVKVHRGWADVGSNGGIFYFDGGPTGNLYPGLMHIFKDQVTPDLVEVEIRPISHSRCKR